MSTIKKALWKLRERLAALFTADCMYCGKPTSGKSCFCEECGKSLLNVGAYFPEHDVYVKAVSAGFYSGAAKAAMLGYKFGKNHENLLPDMLSMLTAAFEKYYSAADFDFAVCVPSFYGDYSESGNRLEELAKAFCKKEGLQFCPVLKKIKRTKRQHDLPAAERRINLEGAFEASAEVHEKRVLLIDDIMTTGSTVLACSNALREKGAAKICVLTVLKTENKNTVT